MNTLRSMFDPTTGSLTLELELAEPLPADARLAFTSIVQLTPSLTA